MKVFNYYKTMNNHKSGYKPFLYFEDLPVKLEYKGCFILDNHISQYLVYDGIIVKECVKAGKVNIDNFMDIACVDYHKHSRPWQAYYKAKEILTNLSN